MRMTVEEIKAAAKAIMKLRTHRETEHNDTMAYKRRPEIDQRLDDLRTKRELTD